MLSLVDLDVVKVCMNGFVASVVILRRPVGLVAAMERTEQEVIYLRVSTACSPEFQIFMALDQHTVNVQA